MSLYVSQLNEGWIIPVEIFSKKIALVYQNLPFWCLWLSIDHNTLIRCPLETYYFVWLWEHFQSFFSISYHWAVEYHKSRDQLVRPEFVSGQEHQNERCHTQCSLPNLFMACEIIKVRFLDALSFILPYFAFCLILQTFYLLWHKRIKNGKYMLEIAIKH